MYKMKPNMGVGIVSMIQNTGTMHEKIDKFKLKNGKTFYVAKTPPIKSKGK